MLSERIQEARGAQLNAEAYSGRGLLMFDKELGQRAISPAVAAALTGASPPTV